MAGGPRKPEEGVLPWEFVLVLWVGATEEEFSKAKGIFLQQAHYHSLALTVNKNSYLKRQDS